LPSRTPAGSPGNSAWLDDPCSPRRSGWHLTTGHLTTDGTSASVLGPTRVG
jgi:hypothetical protein